MPKFDTLRIVGGVSDYKESARVSDILLYIYVMLSTVFRFLRLFENNDELVKLYSLNSFNLNGNSILTIPLYVIFLIMGLHSSGSLKGQILLFLPLLRTSIIIFFLPKYCFIGNICLSLSKQI